MRYLIILAIVFIPTVLFAQLKEFEVSEMERPNVAVVQANSQWPDDALLLVYSSMKGLNFRSSLGSIDKVSYNLQANRYEVLVKPNKQMLFVYASNYVEQKISTLNPNPKDVFYYQVEDKKNVAVPLAKKGTLRVLSDPKGCDVFINDLQLVNTTPFTGQFNAGEIKLRLEKAGFNSIDTLLLLESSETIEVNVVLKPEFAAYEIESRPSGAEVYFDNILIGETPIHGTSTIGKHSVEVRLSGYESQIGRIEIKEDENVTQLYRLSKVKDVAPEIVRNVEVAKRPAVNTSAFSVTGLVTDQKTNTIISGATVAIIGADGSSTETTTDRKGRFNFSLSPQTSYAITVGKKDLYLNETGKLTTVGLQTAQPLTKNFELKQLRGNMDVPNIFYISGKWDLSPDSRPALDNILELLEDNPTIVIEIGSHHTDSKFSDDYNLALSTKRAKSVIDYLVENGIAQARLVGKGYGVTRPRVLDTTVGGFRAGTIVNDAFITTLPSEELKEKAHQLNRRTELKVLRNDYVPR